MPRLLSTLDDLYATNPVFCVRHMADRPRGSPRPGSSHVFVQSCAPAIREATPAMERIVDHRGEFNGQGMSALRSSASPKNRTRYPYAFLRAASRPRLKA